MIEVTRAPGKAMLFGEYAVLEGAPAIVGAVDRYVTVWPADGAAELVHSPFVREARGALIAHHAAMGRRPRLGGLRIDSAPLYAAGAGDRKLGLGSSAAVVVAVFGPQPDLSLGETWLACQKAHSRAQGSAGSGADVAAAIWGGVIRFLPTGGIPDVAPIELQADVALTLVDTGVSASTSERLVRLGSLRRSNPDAYQAALRPLAELAIALAGEAEVHGAIPAFAIDDWNRALAALGAAIDLPIITPEHRAIADCARECGGAAKPSGAGGGDLAVCFTPRGDEARLRAALASRGFAPLDVHVGARGLHRTTVPAVSSLATSVSAVSSSVFAPASATLPKESE